MTEQERREPALGEGAVSESTGGPAVETGGPSVGQRIREARKAAGLSAADLAQPLNLDLRVIENIERDALDEVPGRPYILAYLRSWAGQLGIDPDGLIEQYNRQQGAEREEVQGGTHPTLDVMERPGIAWGRLFGWLVLLLVGAALVLALLQLDTGKVQGWWQDLSGGGRDSAVTTDGDITLSSPSDEAADQAEESGGELEMPPTSAVRPEADSRMPARSALPEGRLPALDDAPTAAEPEQQPTAEETAPTEPAPSPKLVLRAVSGESWVEIRDAAGERLMYDVLAEGERREFDGPGPFSLVLGNPGVLELEYDGESVDLGAAGDATGVLRIDVGES
ncbi:MAG: helix-turn-helix domain-containing protein [Pseudomonadota bacterium]